MESIKVCNLSKLYGNSMNKVVALNDVSFEIKKESLLQL